jgi:glycosyltransferase involved in cell wall biosynthesis
MKISLVICTYMRPLSLLRLLKSIEKQVKRPDEVIVVDGSNDLATKVALETNKFNFYIQYFLVDNKNRGLTKQRNYGVNKIGTQMDCVSFLDDDLVLDPNYFYDIEKTFQDNKDAIGAGGIDLEENRYFKMEPNTSYSKFNFYELDGWVVKEPLRYKIRKIFGLMTNLQPDIIPDYSHGRSGFPPNGKIYEVEHLIGMNMTFKIELLKRISFSSYFEGYGLYEDFDFCVRALPFGKLYVNTNAQVWHYHEPSGRPNQYQYGKMVIRNGWYVWKQRFPNNTLKARFKWHATALLLAKIRLLNSITGPDRFGGLTEYIGRMIGWVTLFFKY